MGLASNLSLLVSIFAAITVFSVIKPMFDAPEKPEVGDVWWGSGEPGKIDSKIKPFKIQVSEDVSISNIQNSHDRVFMI